MKHLIVAATIAVLAIVATDARANNITVVDPNPIPGSVVLSATHTDSLAFTDTWTFTNPGNYSVGTHVGQVSFSTTSNVDFTSATLNGTPLTIHNDAIESFAQTNAPINLTAPIVLIVNGTTGATATQNATYGGNLFVSSVPSSVPEPASLMLLGAGLAGIGLWSWRRKSTR